MPGFPFISSSVQHLPGENNAGYILQPLLLCVDLGGGILISSSFHSADNICLKADSNGKLQTLTDKLATSASACRMEISMDKCNTSGSSKAEIQMNGVQSFKYLGATISKDGSCMEHVHQDHSDSSDGQAQQNLG